MVKKILVVSLIVFLSNCAPAGRIRSETEDDLVGARTAGSATFNRLIDESVTKLLTRHHGEIKQAKARVAFVALENKSAEDLGDWQDQIEQAKSVVKIPVIANGGIFSTQEAENMMTRTGADGVMIGRYALQNPFVFSELSGKEIFSGVKKTFEDKGFRDVKLQLHRDYKPREYCVQYRETDYNFVSRLMQDEGIFYFFEHEKGKHTLLLADLSLVSPQ